MMTHHSLYRKHRPATFGEIVGQEHVTHPLEEAVKSNTVGHAYLFAGSRGLGKTSVARILANTLGCTERDLSEIDAASNNSVEGIRALADAVYTYPFESPYKVYILDEVHMLSKGAWNAFLKTLEEPPAHTVFVLATTELERVPETVQSRCQVFEFKQPSRAMLADVVTQVAKKEGYTFEKEAADLVALLAGGSYRDALSVLQKVLASADTKNVSRAVVETVTGAPSQELVHELVRALGEKNRSAALASVERVAERGADMHLFLDMTLAALRTALLIRTAPELRDTLKSEVGSDDYAVLAGAGDVTHEMLRAFITAAEQIRYAPIPALPLELALFELFPD